MCIPVKDPGAAPVTDIPSMQAASNLKLGGADSLRGGALLGRLKLRAGNRPAKAPVGPTSATTQPDAPSASSVLGFGSQSADDLRPGVFQSTPNLDLHLARD